MITSRRSFLGFLAAPAIVRVASIMPISVPRFVWVEPGIIPPSGIPSFLTTFIDPRVYEVLFRSDDDATLDLSWPQRRQLAFDLDG